MISLESKGLSAFSLLKILFLGLLAPLFLFGFGCGVAAYFGADTVMFNNQNVYGLNGLLIGIGLGIILPMVMSFFLWVLLGIGLWMWTRFGTINLKVKQP